MTKKEAQDLKAILASCPQSPKILLATAIVDKQIAYFEAMKGQLKETWDERPDSSWWL